MSQRKDICFTDLTPQEQATWREAYKRNSTFSPAAQTQRVQENPNNVCVGDLTPTQLAEWRQSRKARL